MAIKTLNIKGTHRVGRASGNTGILYLHKWISNFYWIQATPSISTTIQGKFRIKKEAYKLKVKKVQQFI